MGFNSGFKGLKSGQNFDTVRQVDVYRSNDGCFDRDKRGTTECTYTPLCNTVSVTMGGTRWFSWLRHCDTSRKVAGSIPDGVIGIFY